MQRRLLAVSAFAAAAALGLSACDVTEPYAAKVNGVTIPRGDFEDALAAYVDAGVIPTDESSPATADGQFARQLLGNLILLTALDGAAEDKGLDLARAPQDSVDQLLPQILGGLEADQLPGATSSRMEDGARAFLVLQDYFETLEGPEADALFEEASEGLVCVSHILVATQEEADQVEADLAAGDDFATIAGERSTDTGSAQTGGQLVGAANGTNCYADEELDGFVPEFAEGVRAATPGQPTEPIQSQFGFHVILVEEPTLEQLRPGFFDAYFVSLVADADVNARYGVWNGDTLSVDPLPGATSPTTVPDIEDLSGDGASAG